MRRLHGDQNWSAVALDLMTSLCSGGIIFGSHENRTSIGVGKQMGACVAIQEKAVFGGPVQHSLPAASQNRDIERFDLHLLQYLDTSRCSSTSIICSKEAYGLGMGFAEEALQRPCAALLDLDGYGRERYDPTQVRDISLVSEAGHIVLDPVVPCNQGGGA